MKQSLHDLEKELHGISKNEMRGLVSVSGSQDVLFEYSSTNTSASINLTDLGKKFFNVSVSEIKGLNTFEFANYLGVKVESANDLKAILKVDDIRSANNTELLKYAVEVGRFSVASTLDGLSEQFRKKHCEIPKSMIIRNGSSKKEAKSIIDKNIAREVRNGFESSVYLEGKDGIAKYSAKCSSSRENIKAMAYEHAALVSLHANNVLATNSSIMNGDNGEVYFLKQKIDAPITAVLKDNGKSIEVAGAGKDFYASASWLRIVATGSQASGLIDSRSATNFLIESAAKNRLAAKSLLTMHCFNVLIGNNNVSGNTIGVNKCLIGGESISNRVSHAFDVAPNLMLNPNIQDRRLHSESSLKSLGQSNCYDSNRISSRLINKLEAAHPGLLKDAFDTAVACRNDMEKFIKNELVSGGYISRSEANDFSSYLNHDPSGAISITAKSPFKESGDDAMDRFARKKLEANDNFAINLR